MISSRRMLKVLSGLLPLGAIGVSIALASTPTKPAEAAVAQRDTADRLRAIRSVVSQMAAEQSGLPQGDPNIRQAWWSNWWGPGWRNGGWRNWRNGWNNGPWNNWHNGWGNGWNNGPWNNFWRNW